MKKSGFCALIGRSNVGKSTLLNALVGTKVAITTHKPQTTRHQIQGVVHDPRGQIVLVDTPGIFEHPRDQVTRALNRAASAALTGVDVIVHVVDPTRPRGNEEHIIERLLANTKVPKLLVINKMDERHPLFRTEYNDREGYRGVYEISALRHRGLKPLVDAVIELLPEGEPYYPEFQFSPVDHAFWIAELIREKVFIQMGAEIPYTTTVAVSDVRNDDEKKPPLCSITAAILTSNPRHKSMLIGAGGRKIREIGGASRKELEMVLGRKVFLDLTVEIDERWPERLSDGV